MITIDIRDMSPQLVDLFRRAIQGEDILIVEDAMPVVWLMPIQTGLPSRIVGLYQGSV